MDISPLITQLKIVLATLAMTTITIGASSNGLPQINLASSSEQSSVSNNIAPNVPTGSGLSRNWSGYAVTDGTFTGVNGSWKISSPQANGHFSSDATWVGIGGVTKTDLIQVGTQSTVNANGQVSFQAWVEKLPAASEEIPVAIHAGDSVSASLNQTGFKQWTLQFKNETTGQVYDTSIEYNSSLSSAEWIEEAPSDGRTVLPLDNFGTVSFSSASAIKDGNSVSIAGAGGQAITMGSTAGQIIASASDLNDSGDGFTVTRGSADVTSPIPGNDPRLRGWRRRGEGPQGFVIRVRRIQTPRQIVSPTPQPSTDPAETLSPKLIQLRTNFGWGRRNRVF